MYYCQDNKVLEINYINNENRHCKIHNMINRKLILNDHINNIDKLKVIYKDDIWYKNIYKMEYEKYIFDILNIKYLVSVNILHIINFD